MTESSDEEGEKRGRMAVTRWTGRRQSIRIVFISNQFCLLR